jgi:hypothetical protein
VGIYNLISIFYYYWNVLLIFDVIVTVASILLRCQFGWRQKCRGIEEFGAGWVVRVTTSVHNYFMGETRRSFIETRIIRAQLKFEFSGAETAVFKPGMPFEGHVYVMYIRRQSGPFT